jgi:hypothetical protein
MPVGLPDRLDMSQALQKALAKMAAKKGIATSDDPKKKGKPSARRLVTVDLIAAIKADDAEGTEKALDVLLGEASA